MRTQNTFFIEMTTNNSVSYFHIVRRRDDAILYSYDTLACAAYRLFVNMNCIPTYKDGTIVILNTNKKENAIIQIINQNLVELSKKYDTLQQEMAAMEKKGQFNYHLYKEMLRSKIEMELAQQKKNSLILISK